jgi:UDP-4-amino-4,6-dideoxy-N-acetyl-beta-L-altrosamine N-acetyltransferase
MKDNLEYLKSIIKFGSITFVPFYRLDPEEISLILKWRNDQRIRKWMINKKIISKKDHLKFIKTLRTSNDQFYWLVQIENQYLGIVNITEVDFKNKHCYWGFYLNPQYLLSGKGLILEYYLLEIVFRVMKFHCLRAKVVQENINNISLQNYFGFKRDGILRDVICVKNKTYQSLLLMSIINTEWTNKRLKIKKMIEKLIRIKSCGVSKNG